MFLESEIDHSIQKGSIEVICGSMFSGKTEELLRRIKRAQFAKLKIAVFKPKLDVRYDTKKIVSHDSNEIKSITVDSASEILNLIKNEEVIAIDEAQFFNSNLVFVCTELANQNRRVIVAGLDMDFLGKPFGEIPQLLAVAEHITKVHAICSNCNNTANYSFRLTKNKKLVELGQKNEYIPLCRKCFNRK